jgi:hypothetical protein
MKIRELILSSNQVNQEELRTGNLTGRLVAVGRVKDSTTQLRSSILPIIHGTKLSGMVEAWTVATIPVVRAVRGLEDRRINPYTFRT